MWIVRVALQRPYTFIMLAVLIVFLGVYSILRMPTDIFPNIKIPIAAVIWRYTRPAARGDRQPHRACSPSARAQTVVNDVEHTESQSVNSEAVVKYFFQPNANQDLSMAQIIAVSQTQLQTAPPGTTPAFRAVLQRLERADPAAGAVERDHPGAGDLRSRQQHPAHPARDGRGRLDTLSVRRQAAPGAGRPRSAASCAPAGSPPTTWSTRSRAESHPARRHGEDRHPGVFHQAQCEPHEDRAAQRSADPGIATAACCTCATWRTCATAIRRKPTSRASTASAPS